MRLDAALSGDPGLPLALVCRGGAPWRRVALVRRLDMLPWLRATFELQDLRHARLLPMEGLRGTAVLLVFLQHYTVQALLIGLEPGATATLAAGLRWYGNFGVELFFVLSGYLIYGTLLRKAPSFLAFMARRIERLYPTFLAVFGLGACLGNR